MACERCVKRGQTWTGDAPICAFPDKTLFTSANWNCATMNELRTYAEPSRCFSDDQNAGLVGYNGEFIVLYWYKNHGRTEAAWGLTEEGTFPLALSYAEEVFDARRSA